MDLGVELSPELWLPSAASSPQQAPASKGPSNPPEAAGFAALMQVAPEPKAQAPGHAQAALPQAALPQGSSAIPPPRAAGASTVQDAPSAPIRVPVLPASALTSMGAPSERESGRITAGAPVADNLLPMPLCEPGGSGIDALALSTAQDASAETAIGPIDPGSLDRMGRMPGEPSTATQPATQVSTLVSETWTAPREGGPLPLAPDLTQGGPAALTEAAIAPADPAAPVGTALEPASPENLARPAASASGSPTNLSAWPDEGQTPVIDAAPAADREAPTTDRPTTRPAADQTMPASRALDSRLVDLVAVQPASVADFARNSSGGEIAPSAHAIDGTNPSFSTGGLAHTARAERATFFPVHDQVALHVSKALEDGRTEIRIHLRPADLGDVDIRLDFHDLRLTATVSADRAETLDLLQRDARGLTRAFREAGVDIDQSGLSFTHSGRGGHSGDRAGDLQDPAPLTVAADEPDGPPVQAQVVHRGLLALWDGRVDVLV